MKNPHQAYFFRNFLFVFNAILTSKSCKTYSELDKCKRGISYRGPFIWDNFLSIMDKQITDVAKFKAVNKSKLLSLENEVSFF